MSASLDVKLAMGKDGTSNVWIRHYEHLQRRSYTNGHKNDAQTFDQSIHSKNSAGGYGTCRASHVRTLRPRKIIKSFRFTTKPLGFNITITETTKNQPIPTYFAVSTIFNPKQPDIMLYAGASREGELLGVAHYRYSRHIKIGFGNDTSITADGVWEEMKNTSKRLGHGRYEFEYSVPPDTADFVWDVGATAGRVRRRFFWERTRDQSDGVRGAVEQSVGWRNYRLFEQDTGRVLAVMLVDMFTGAAYKGVLNVYVTLCTEMKRVVVMTATCIMDKGERRIGHYAFGPVTDS